MRKIGRIAWWLLLVASILYLTFAIVGGGITMYRTWAYGIVYDEEHPYGRPATAEEGEWAYRR